MDGGSCYTVCDNDYSYRSSYRNRYSARSCGSSYAYSRPRTYRRTVNSSYYAARSTSPCTNVVINNSGLGDGAPYSWST